MSNHLADNEMETKVELELKYLNKEEYKEQIISLGIIPEIEQDMKILEENERRNKQFKSL